MVEQISGAMPMQPMQSSTALTNDQKTVITDTLAEYDVDNLTEDQAETIVATLSEAGIQPGREMADIMSEAGFDARSIGDMAGRPEGSRPPPPPPSDDSQNVELSSVVDYVAELVAKQLESEDDYASLSDESKETIYADVAEKFALEQGQSILDIIV